MWVVDVGGVWVWAGDMEGYGWAALNIVVDVLGAVIVKQHALPLQAWEINLVSSQTHTHTHTHKQTHENQ